ncbi:MAG TPA: PrsW family glutamic-type intramembrane protease [Polyangiaceae bacterium]|jgi:RsiW-degrading membrane proteinase PrsW (M82 family)|nr:PrsW family glutamic-type intramembrane protease [Polyangiaceae bacterium]
MVMRFVLAALPLLLGLAVFLRVRPRERISRRLALWAALGGALAGALGVELERVVLSWTDLSFDVRRSGTSGALLATFLLAAPLEEALKVLVVWPLYRRRRIGSARLGLTYAVAAAAGFAALKTIFVPYSPGDHIGLVRSMISAPAQLFFAGLWGFALGGTRLHDRWFRLAWLVAMLLHGLYDHIVWGRGPGLLVAAIPMLLFMAFGTVMALRGEEPVRHLAIIEPPTIEAVQARLAHPERPVMLRWIVAGAFVTLGLVIALVAGAVVLGNRLNIDFSLADEADVRSSGPLVLLGVAVLAAFPLSGYLVARASSAQGLLEPAAAAALTLGLLVFMLWLAAPIGVLFALAVAPIALGLACGGAWIGLER